MFDSGALFGIGPNGTPCTFASLQGVEASLEGALVPANTGLQVAGAMTTTTESRLTELKSILDSVEGRKRDQIRKELKDRGMKQAGNKVEIAERLHDCIKGKINFKEAELLRKEEKAKDDKEGKDDEDNDDDKDKDVNQGKMKDDDKDDDKGKKKNDDNKGDFYQSHIAEFKKWSNAKMFINRAELFRHYLGLCKKEKNEINQKRLDDMATPPLQD
jgi:hypothetical protein